MSKEKDDLEYWFTTYKDTEGIRFEGPVINEYLRDPRTYFPVFWGIKNAVEERGRTGNLTKEYKYKSDPCYKPLAFLQASIYGLLKETVPGSDKDVSASEYLKREKRFSSELQESAMKDVFELIKPALENWDSDFFIRFGRLMKDVETELDEASFQERFLENESTHRCFSKKKHTVIHEAVHEAFLLLFHRRERLPTIAEWKSETNALLDKAGIPMDDKQWDRVKRLYSMKYLNKGDEARGRRPEILGESEDPYIY